MRVGNWCVGILAGVGVTLASVPAQAIVFGGSFGADTGAVDLILNGGAISLDSVDGGWYNSDGLQGDIVAPNNDNFAVSRANDPADPLHPQAHNNYFVFNLSGLGPITQAVLRLNSFQVNRNESYTLFDFGGDIDDLIGGAGGLAAFDDLGSGAAYGTRDYTPADSHQILDITLNASFIADLNAAIQAQQTRFAFGGTVSPAPLQVPEPGALLLLGAGLLGLGLTRRKR